jgi:para-nitrobenzyl esterase
MAVLMSSTFAAFARTGNPNVPGVPHWPTYNPVQRETFIYDLSPKVVADPNPQFRAYWEKQALAGTGGSALKDAMSGKNFKSK